MALETLIQRLKYFVFQITTFMENGQPIKEAQLQVKTDLKDLEEVLQWFEQFNLPIYLPSDLWWQYKIVITEGFTNTVRHAHRGLPSTTPIDIDAKIFLNYVEMRIWDYGPPFDLEKKLEEFIRHPNPDPGIEEGGRGLLLMYQLTNDLRYIRKSDNSGNCLIMGKRIRPLNKQQ